MAASGRYDGAGTAPVSTKLSRKVHANSACLIVMQWLLSHHVRISGRRDHRQSTYVMSLCL